MPEIFVGHRVLDGPVPQVGPDAAGAVTATDLEAFLKAHRSRPALSLDMLPAAGERRGPAPYMLTFDDGFEDFSTVALPLLERYDVPAILFVTADWMTGRSAPYEYVIAAILDQAEGAFEIGGRTMTVENDQDRQRVYETLRLSARVSPPSSRRALVENLAAALCTDPDAVTTPHFVCADELARLARHELVTIGAHSVTHRTLSDCALIEAWREIAGSVRALRDVLGRRVEAFAYPYGAHNRLTGALLPAAGLRWGFTTENAPVRDLRITGRYRLPRRNLAAWRKAQ